jgi:hypothetical protein
MVLSLHERPKPSVSVVDGYALYIEIEGVIDRFRF